MKKSIDKLWIDGWDRIRGYAWKAVEGRLAQFGRYASFDEIEQLAANAISEAYSRATERSNATAILWCSRKPEPRLAQLLRVLSKCVNREIERERRAFHREQKLLGKFAPGGSLRRVPVSKSDVV